MNEKEFHAARRMFAVWQRTLFLAPEGYPYSHHEWLSPLVGSDRITQCLAESTRGYVLGERLMAYMGPDFSHRVRHADVLLAYHVLRHLHTITGFGFGAKPAQESPWPAKVNVPVETYLASTAAQRAGETHAP